MRNLVIYESLIRVISQSVRERVREVKFNEQGAKSSLQFEMLRAKLWLLVFFCMFGMTSVLSRRSAARLQEFRGQTVCCGRLLDGVRS